MIEMRTLFCLRASNGKLNKCNYLRDFNVKYKYLLFCFVLLYFSSFEL